MSIGKNINNQFDWPVFCDELLGIGYLPVPKAANTSILNAFFSFKNNEIQSARLNSIPKDKLKVSLDDPARVHLYGKELFDSMRNKSNVNDYFVFTCVRSPVSRFISFYKDKICRWDPYIEKKLLSLGFEKHMNLDQCIENLCSIKNPLTLDQHIMPMTLLLYHDGKLVPDYIMKTQTLNDDWRFLISYLGLPESELKVENLSSRTVRDEVYLDSTQKSKILNYYYDDVHLFGFF